MSKMRLFPPLLEKMGKWMCRNLPVLLISLFLLPGIVYGQEKISVKIRRGDLTDAFYAIQRNTNYRFLYSTEDLHGIQIDEREFAEADAGDVLRSLLAGSGLTWQINENVISIKKVAAAQSQVSPATITGRVTDESGNPLSGVTVHVKGTRTGATTDNKGNFSLKHTATGETVIEFSFVGKKTVEIPYREGQIMNVVMEETSTKVDEVVVTGLFTRAKESFTGSTATFSRTELQSVGNTNIFQSLKTLDPSFAIIESNEYGSDPNRLPNIEIRGKTSVIGLTEEYGTDPNQPLFILDGFQSSLREISDLSMDMVESITILKDAASTAIYGSKSANGVIVVQTRRPAAGELKITYKGDFQITFPDLSDYNLMNAKEKLQYELLSGGWGSIDENGRLISESNYIDYMRVYKEVERGVDTYWLNIPLRTAFTNKHNTFISGGTPEIRYGIGVNYGSTQGVMKDSDREVIGGSLRLEYEKGKLLFKNKLTVENVTTEREKVEFSRFARMNPYFRKTDEDGNTPMLYGIQRYNYIYPYKNPYWDMNLNSFDKSTLFGFTNNLDITWKILDELRAEGRFGIGKTANKQTVFKSPFHTDFIDSTQEQTGSYGQSNGDNFILSGDALISYGKIINDIHQINAGAGFTFRQETATYSQYSVTGFIDEDYPNPNFALGYRPDSKPVYSESRRREASYFFNGGYSYKNRYLVDANYRLDGSSIFGSSKRFTQTWSAGLAWNMHNEAFFWDSQTIDSFRIRASIGNPGNQNFNDYISLQVYMYNLSNPNIFGPSMIINNFGNSDLDWQKTIDKNIGLDLYMFRSRLKFTFDYFHKFTDPLLIYIGTPSSTGVTKIPKNIGNLITKGMTVTTSYQIIASHDITWSVNATMRSIKTRYENFGDQMKRYNLDNYGTSLTRYYDGGSPNDLWAMRSLGIDPATGREILLKKDGSTTFLYDYEDEVIVGNTEPDYEGVIGMAFRYKQLSVAFNFRYELGGQAFMSALYNKVEKIDERFENQDKRALYDRWKNPGDQAKFKGIMYASDTQAQYRMSSRFVMDNNVLTGESITVSYQTQGRWLRSIGASSLTFNAYMNDIFRLSSIKNERVIEYPYARSVSFSIGLNF